MNQRYPFKIIPPTCEPNDPPNPEDYDSDLEFVGDYLSYLHGSFEYDAQIVETEQESRNIHTLLYNIEMALNAVEDAEIIFEGIRNE